MHSCPQCQLEHVRIPHLFTFGPNKEKLALVPQEILATMEGLARPGDKTPWDTSAMIITCFWGLPGDQAKQFSFLYMN